MQTLSLKNALRKQIDAECTKKEFLAFWYVPDNNLKKKLLS